MNRALESGRGEREADLEGLRVSETELQNRLNEMDTQLKESETGLADLSAKNNALEEKCSGLSVELNESRHSKVIIYYIFCGMG